jgi:CRISPR-associated RAMP protein (TIGR02581 family)
MLKQLVNECLIELVIRPDGPILIKSGIETVSGPDMSFVRTWRNGEEQVFLPGSSLKGVLRSHAERITRTFDESKACDPFGDNFCGARFESQKKQRGGKGPENHEVYRNSCPICLLFGSTWYGGRLATADAYAEDTPRREQRDGVGIDRFTGGSSRGAKFELEVVTSGEFATSLHLRNFELWQLGLVGFLLQDLKDGLIRVGMGKSRGLGKVSGEVTGVRLDFLGPQAPDLTNGSLTLKGVGEMVPEEMAGEYGMTRPDELPVPFAGQWQGGPGRLRKTALFPGDTFPWQAVGPRWVSYVGGE